MSKAVLESREKFFNELLDHYSKLAKEDPRYNKTCEKLKNGKEEFLKGKTLVQVIKG
jgi:hypothetical protein